MFKFLSKRQWALIAASIVCIIYALNYSIAKTVMPHYVKPFGFILFRVVGGAMLFWLVGLLGPKERIEREDYPRLFLASLFGVGLNMLVFFYGLNLTTPISASVMMVTTPMITLILAVIFLKEKLKALRILGLLLGFGGTLIMILYGKSQIANAPDPFTGNICLLINAASFASYLIVVKKLTQKYHPFTFMKWLYTIGCLLVLPFGLPDVLEMDFSILPKSAYWVIFFVVFFVTFGTYILNIFAIRALKPTTVAVFVYFQPLLATLIAITSGADKLDRIKVIAAILIFSGVYLVGRNKKTEIKN